MADAAKDMQRTFPMCEEGLRAKVYRDGASFGRKEFDVLLGDYAYVSSLNRNLGPVPFTNPRSRL